MLSDTNGLDRRFPFHRETLLANENIIDEWIRGEPGFNTHIALYAGCCIGRNYDLSSRPILVIQSDDNTYLKSRRYYCASLKNDIRIWFPSRSIPASTIPSIIQAS